jgi:hypothetical protein
MKTRGQDWNFVLVIIPLPPGVGVKIIAVILTISAQEVIFMRRRKVYFLAVLGPTALLILWGVAMPTPAKEETVTLSITGMT